MGGIGIILNRNAGKRKLFHTRVDHKLAFVLGDRDSIRQTDSIEEIEEVARFFKFRNIDILGIGGGDGSNHLALTTFIKVYNGRALPKVAFLRGGTHNAHAVSIGLTGKPQQILSRIVQKYHTNGELASTLRKVLKVHDGQTIRYGFTLGTGFLCQFYKELQLRQAESKVKLAGFLGSSVVSIIFGRKALHEMFDLQPATVSISNQILKWPEHNSITCSTMENVGMGFKPYPRANDDPALFQAVVLRVRPRAFAKMMWSFRLGRLYEHSDIYNTLTDHLVVRSDRPISYVLDGEIYQGSGQLTISTGPQIDILLV